MISHQSLSEPHQQAHLKVWPYLWLTRLHPAHHQPMERTGQRDYRVPEMLERDFHQHYLLQVPVHHQPVVLRSQRSFVAVHLGYQLRVRIHYLVRSLLWQWCHYLVQLLLVLRLVRHLQELPVRIQRMY